MEYYLIAVRGSLIVAEVSQNFEILLHHRLIKAGV